MSVQFSIVPNVDFLQLRDNCLTCIYRELPSTEIVPTLCTFTWPYISVLTASRNSWLSTLDLRLRRSRAKNSAQVNRVENTSTHFTNPQSQLHLPFTIVNTPTVNVQTIIGVGFTKGTLKVANMRAILCLINFTSAKTITLGKMRSLTLLAA